MRIGALRLVLQACSEMPGDSDGWLLDTAIAQQTGLGLPVIRDCIESLDDRGYIRSVRRRDDFMCQITAEGRLFVSQRRGFTEETKSDQAEPGTIKVVPKGLRSFDEHDADFFLDLLPGPRRSDRLPESVHFWKYRIDEPDPNTTFRVGAIYGPSGCGKSSLVKAGLLPNLAAHVRHVYIEATANRTEQDLLKGIHRRCPDVAPSLGLIESLAALRDRTVRSPGEKTLLVLDQFEQWLLEHRAEEGADLVRAFQYCDGEYVQAILMVRDDFLAATIRFMKELGVEFRPDHNACEVELFSPRHAEKVLTAFGRAEGILRDDLTPDQQRFVAQSVKALARNGGLVIPVRLAMFFQTVKNEDWSPKTLRKYADAEGVGAAFLEKAFNDEYANRRHRDHQEAAQLVLGALLPASGREIKRPSRARQDLLEASGYSSRPERFNDLIHILDEELRLITAVDQDVIVVAESPTQTSGERERFYQLTHDFLAPSLREWRSNKGQEASQLVEAIRVSETRDVLPLVSRLSPLRYWANPLLRRIVESSGVESKERLHASLSLLPVDEEQVEFLYPRMLDAGPPDLLVLRGALRPFREILIERLWRDLEQSDGTNHTLQAASALALYDPSDQRWGHAGSKVARAMVTVNAVHLGYWLEALRPARDKLTSPLATVFRDRERPESERNLASNLLEDYATDQPLVLTKLLMDSEEERLDPWFEKLARHRNVALSLLSDEIARPLPDTPESDKDMLAQRQARAAVALVRMGRADEVWPKLGHGPDPRLRNFIMNWLPRLGANPQEIASELDRIGPVAKPTPAKGQQAMDAILFNSENSVRRALILALGTYGTEGLSPEEREPMIAGLLEMYRDDPDAGIHGAAEWTLGRWNRRDNLRVADAGLMKLVEGGDRRWFVNGQGQTFSVIDGPVEFLMGSPETDPERCGPELLHVREIPRRFAIATKEVTVEQYQEFQEQNPKIERLGINRYNPDQAGPMNGLTWYEAASYCNWLSEKEKIPEVEWCYEPRWGEYVEGMAIPDDVLERRGYRLPTEAEWEYACRAGTLTSRYYGPSVDLLSRYARYSSNCDDHAWPCGGLFPNDLGLFDMLGNVYEWCQGAYVAYQPDDKGRMRDIINTLEIISENNPRALRGGAFYDLPSGVRSASRIRSTPSDRNSYGGLRLARTCR